MFSRYRKQLLAFTELADRLDQSRFLLQSGMSQAKALQLALLSGRTSLGDTKARTATLRNPIVRQLQESLATSEFFLYQAVSTAKEFGAPLGAVLLQTANYLRKLSAMLGQIIISSSSAMATMRLIVLLPVLAVLLVEAMGFAVLSTVFNSPVLIMAVLFGAGLIYLGHRRMVTIIEKSCSANPTLGAISLLVALGLKSGLPLRQSFSRVAQSWQSESALADLAESELAALEQVLALGQKFGTPVAELLLTTADQLRARQQLELEERLSLLPTKLLLPLGLFILPGFVLLAVFPAAVTILVTTSY